MERVHYQQEQMLDELKDLLEKGVFTKPETKQILKKRTEFETALVRRVAKKADFLRYVAYEMSLEQLRRKRIERLNIPTTKATVSDYSLVRRQFNIFERALKRFKADVDLWIEYINVAKREGASTLVGRVVARAIQLHPDKASLYVLAAAHEMEHGTPSAARTLLQRGIRINGESVDLWTEYVRMELTFMESVRKRWDVLGLDPKENDTEEAQARAGIMQGAIVKSVISQAPCSTELFERLIYEVIKVPGELLDAIYGRLAGRADTDARSAALYARRHIDGRTGTELVDGVQRANEEMLGRCKAGGVDFYRAYVGFCETLSGQVEDVALKEYLEVTACAQLMRIVNHAVLASPLDPSLVAYIGSSLVPRSSPLPPHLLPLLTALDGVGTVPPSPYRSYIPSPMLQFPTPHPPLCASEYSRPNDLFPRPIAKRQLDSHFSPSSPLSISTNLPRQPSPSAKLRSPYISSRPSPANFSPRPAFKSPSSHSSFSSVLEDVLQPGDIVGDGVELQGEMIRLVSPLNGPTDTEPAREFEVVRRLGAGSYAVVYQVLEVLERAPPSEDGHSVMGHMDFDGKHCLSKANLDDEALRAQMDEVTIHQSLHSHPNIVTLHRTLETSSFLLLLLEYVPGEDLFYFLEQAHDHYESSHTPETADSSSRTPPTPSLLSTMNSSQLLSRTRLRLISSMFSQMCDAVAACHAQAVFHRDIKPENFIVTDGFIDVDGRRERKVIVKLTDFGLSTTDVESSDMDCGSAPYMSYECRNNVAPSYRPRAADVWSLGIVLINMLYHYNPWTDTKEGACSSFDLFRQQPVNFFMQRFVGMTRPVAEHLANKVFNILDDPNDDSERISAAGFGMWAKDLPDLLSPSPGHQRAGSTASLTHGHRISCSIPISHRPSSRQASGTASTIRTPAIPSRSLSRAGSFGPTIETTYEKPEAPELSTVIDQDMEEQEEERRFKEEVNDATEDQAESRSPSTNKRRKRGARKGKGGSQPPPSTPKDETLETLASASQSLAREISRTSRATSRASSYRSTTTHSSKGSRKGQPFEPVVMWALPTPILGPPRIPPVPPLPKLNVPAPSQTTAIPKKPSKWKLSFGKSSGATTLGHISPVEEATVPVLDLPMSATASNVSDLIMGLSAAPPPPTQVTEEFPRGRRGLEPGRRGAYNPSRSPHPSSSDHWQFDSDLRSERAVSPNSTRSHRPVGSSSSSMISGNWRTSTSTTSSATTSTSAFTRYSNASMRSVSTTATSVSASSWRAPKPPSPTATTPTQPVLIPKNVKLMNGVPWELAQLPRGQYTGNPEGDIFGSPPVRQPRPRKPKDLQLSTITERPVGAAPKSPEFMMRCDASTSTTDLTAGGLSPREEEGDGPKKVPKGQINALAKMLSALRR
ncbi:Kinase-like protein [Mycena kentingensis (nom. inval.)]|nr:Kinase-like protein [Mycena kentingensis (nom. inval.)]